MLAMSRLRAGVLLVTRSLGALWSELKNPKGSMLSPHLQSQLLSDITGSLKF